MQFVPRLKPALLRRELLGSLASRKLMWVRRLRHENLSKSMELVRHVLRRARVTVTQKRFTFLFAAGIFVTVNAQAQPAEEGRSLWDHNGSTMYLVAKDSAREFYYQKPRQGMLEVGAHPDDLLFRGQINDGQISGTAFIFNAQCGQFPFHVKGSILDEGGRIVLTGQAPHVGRNCQSYGDYTSTLEFKLLKTSEATQLPTPTAQMPIVEQPTPEPSPSDAAEAKLSNDPSAQPTRARQTPWVACTRFG